MSKPKRSENAFNMYVSRRNVITLRAFSIRKDIAKIMKILIFTFMLMYFLYNFCIKPCIRAIIMEIIQKKLCTFVQ